MHRGSASRDAGATGLLPLYSAPVLCHVDPLPPAKTGLLRVLRRISNRPAEFPAITYEVIVVFPLPKGAFSFQLPIDNLRGIRFPTVQYRRQAGGLKWLKHRMYVVWHNAPGKEPVSDSFERDQRACHYFRYLRHSQGAFSGPPVEIFFHLLRSSTVHCVLPLKIHSDSGDDVLGQRIGQSKRDKIDACVLLPMRKSSATPNS
jgi:hypothetical protein